MKNKYIKTCKYCNKEIIVNHLNRRYCDNVCKRSAFRDKNENTRGRIKNKNKIDTLNTSILQYFFENKKLNLTLNEMESKGFILEEFDYRFKLDNITWLIYSNDYHLEIENEGENKNINIIKIKKNGR